MTDNDKRLERIKERAEGMGLKYATGFTDKDPCDGVYRIAQDGPRVNDGTWAVLTFTESGLDTAESLLSVLDPEAVEVEIHPDRVRVYRAGYVSVGPAPEGFRYVLALQRVPRG